MLNINDSEIDPVELAREAYRNAWKRYLAKI
jgi:hypothetical protein